jgi:glycosyltransferase involved in cell wall biosynthesis
VRILQVVPTYYPAFRYGGPIRSIHTLCKALVQAGHEVHVFTTNVDGPGELDVPVDEPVRVDGVYVHYFPVPGALRRLYWSPRMRAALNQRVADFDVVHLHSVYLWPTWAAARAARRRGVPYVVAPEGMLVRELIRRKSRWLKTAWIHLIERRSIAQAAGLHVMSACEAEEAQALRLNLTRTFYVPNGVEMPQQHSLLADGPFADLPRPYALSLGRINWKKGLDRLIKAWKYVPGLPLVIAGNDEEHYQPQLERLAQAEGVAARVHFIGAVTDEQKWALYENARLFALPSYSENFGIVVAEAMGMGCAVVVTPEVGMAALVRETDAGIVVSGEARELADAVHVLDSDADLRHRLGANGRRAVAEHLSPRSVAQQMEQVYRQILETRGATVSLGTA